MSRRKLFWLAGFAVAAEFAAYILWRKRSGLRKPSAIKPPVAA